MPAWSGVSHVTTQLFRGIDTQTNRYTRFAHPTLAAGARPPALLARRRYAARSVSFASIVRITRRTLYAATSRCVMHAPVHIPTL